MADVTQILSQIDSGDPSASELLLPLVYEELRKLAAVRLAHEKPGQTLQATALVHEAYLRLVDANTPWDWNSRGHFFGAAAEAMRRILVENARRKLRTKHGGQLNRVNLPAAEIVCNITDDELLDLNESLELLQNEDPQKAELVRLRFFAGLSNEQAAEALQISAATAKRHWRYARAWLHRALHDGDKSAN